MVENNMDSRLFIEILCILLLLKLKKIKIYESRKFVLENRFI